MAEKAKLTTILEASEDIVALELWTSLALEPDTERLVRKSFST